MRLFSSNKTKTRKHQAAKVLFDTFRRFDTILECDGRPDNPMDTGQRLKFYIYINVVFCRASHADLQNQKPTLFVQFLKIKTKSSLFTELSVKIAVFWLFVLPQMLPSTLIRHHIRIKSHLIAVNSVRTVQFRFGLASTMKPWFSVRH